MDHRTKNDKFPVVGKYETAFLKIRFWSLHSSLRKNTIMCLDRFSATWKRTQFFLRAHLNGQGSEKISLFAHRKFFFEISLQIYVLSFYAICTLMNNVRKNPLSYLIMSSLRLLTM